MNEQDIQLELLNEDNIEEVRAIHREDISEDFVNGVDAIMEINQYGINHHCIGHTYAIQYLAFLTEFGKGKKMVLSTSWNDKVTSRMMSVVQQNGIFYFQTDRHFRKYDQLMKNQNVALCIDNIQIEGIGKELGHPLEDPVFCSLYKECFSSSFERYSSLSNEVLFAVTPLFVERWLYKEGIPFVETFNIEKKEYCIQEYKSL